MNESKKTIPSLKRNGEWQSMQRLLKAGKAIDIGAGDWPIELPNGHLADRWDMEQGDAMLMEGVADGSYSVAIASHVIEHVEFPRIALVNWSRILQKGGLLIVMAPDFMLYEHGHWPSRYNSDHKWRFTLFDSEPLPKLMRFSEMLFLAKLAGLELVDARLTCDGYDFTKLHVDEDQTLGPALAQVTYVFRK